nr:hypothetical protein [Saprospiraceae bacterium]
MKTIYQRVPHYQMLPCAMFLILLAALLPYSTLAQLPSSSVYLVPFPSEAVEQKPHTTMEYLLASDFNPGGYNHQPFFADKNTLLLSSGQHEQTDLVQLDLENIEKKRLTATEESEFSPGINPRNGYLSFVRMEEDGVQRLWTAPADLSNNGSPVTPLHLKVGYYQWLRGNLIALYLLREDHHEIIVWNSYSGEEKFLTKKPGRSLQSDQLGRLYYVIKKNENVRHIYRYDPTTQNSQLLVRMPTAGSEDFCLGPDGILLNAVDNVIMGFRPDIDSSWQPILTLQGMENQRITRLASNGVDYLCFVVEH